MRLLSLLFVLLSTASAQAKPAFVDVQRALRSVSAGKAAYETLRELTQARQSQLDSLRDALATIQTDVEKTPVADVDLLRQRHIKLRALHARLQEMHARFQHELETEEARLMRPIRARLRRIAARISAERGTSILFDAEQAPVLWAARRFDLTDELIRRFERGEGP
jgi:outer membrane protein